MLDGLITALLVAVRIAATTWGNVVQKRLLTPGRLPPLELFAAIWGWMTLLMCPWWISAIRLDSVFWGWLLLTCLLEVPGNVLLLRSLQQTELSIFGPLSSFKPVVSLLLAFCLFGERPGVWGLFGVVIVLLGTLWLTSQRSASETRLSREARWAGVRDRLLAVVLTAVASVFLKQGMAGHDQAQVLGVWCLLSWLLATLWRGLAAATTARSSAASPPADVFQRSMNIGGGRLSTSLRGRAAKLLHSLREQIFLLRPDSRGIFIVAVAMLVMQAATISLFARMPVGYALALFQIGSLVSVIIGHRLFGEADLVRRSLAAGVMILGAIIIIVYG